MCRMNRECLAGIFIYHGQHFIGPVITQLVMHEIDGPHMVRPIGTHTDDGAIFMIKPMFTFMALWQLQPLFTPNSFDFLVIYLPTRDPEQLCYLTVPIPPIHLCKSDYVMPERIFIPVFALIRHCRACNA